MSDQLYIITTIYNPKQYQSLYLLYQQFSRSLEIYDHVTLYTVELAYGKSPFKVTKSSNPHHIQLRTDHELWHKENLINIGVSNLPNDWERLAILDADIRFVDPNWVDNTIEALRHYPIVQMFSESIDLSCHHTLIQKFNGFVYAKHILNDVEKLDRTLTGHAWAYNRNAYEKINGVFEYAIVGGGDYYMCHSLFGDVKEGLEDRIGEACPEFRNMLLKWESNAFNKIKGNVGHLSGLILHYWHGRKSSRGYSTRHRHLYDNDYNPRLDLRKTSSGLLELTDHNPKLTSGLRDYFTSRNEDDPLLM